jgi:hypothetical protein
MADRYFFVDVHFGHKKTCARLLDKFGHAGPLVYLLVLAEAKKNTPAGTFTYESEEAGWRYLGLLEHPPDFTLEAFFAVTGQLKQTRRTRRGRITDVKWTAWGRWQKDWERERVRKTMRRKRAHSESNNGVTQQSQDRNTSGTEIEIEIDTPLPPNLGYEQPNAEPPDEDNLARVRELAATIGIRVDAPTSNGQAREPEPDQQDQELAAYYDTLQPGTPQ